MAEILRVIFYDPLYNALVGLLDLFPGGNVGAAVIALTILVKLVLLPLSIKASRTQVQMKKLEPELRELKKKYPKREEQAVHIMELYRSRGVNPFAGILILFLQLPVIFALYFVFYKGGLPTVDLETLYSFIPAPEQVTMTFLGIDMAGRSIILAILAGVTQFIQAYFAMPEPPPKTEDGGFAEEFARSMHLQARYVLPVIVGVISFTISSAVALYWTTSNIVAIIQEWYVRRRLLHNDPPRL